MRLYLWAAPLVAMAAWAQEPTPALPDTVTLESNIAYDSYPETKLDILRPKEPAKGKRPGVLVIHGGGWIRGTKESQLATMCLTYVRRGFVCASVEYRLAKAATAPAAVTDVLKAAQWFRKNAKKYGVDPGRLVVSGGSAGGHLTLMVAMTPGSAKLGPPAHVRAAVNFYGITEVADVLGPPNLRDWAVEWVPESPGRLRLAGLVSPLTYVRKNLPPILTIHGDADPTVPYEQGVRLTKALRDAGAQAELVSVPGGRHGFPKETLDRLYEQNVWPFLKKCGVL